ncbi:unnamed protein product, partial [Musa textilis]
RVHGEKGVRRRRGRNAGVAGGAGGGELLCGVRGPREQEEEREEHLLPRLLHQHLHPLRSRPPLPPTPPAQLSFSLLLPSVRRYVYNDVVRLDDLEKLVDCCFVQPYTINSAKVVFLKPRPQSRPSKGSGNICLTCDRILQEPFHFCSLSCKVDHVLLRGEDLSSILFRFEDSDFAFSRFESLQVDEDDGPIAASATLEQPAQSKEECLPPSHGGGSGSSGTRKSRFFPRIVLSLNNRRKGAPHRSPLS